MLGGVTAMNLQLLTHLTDGGTVKRLFSALLTFVIPIVLVSPLSAADAPIVSKVPNGENKIALTFDDGPHPVHTERILEILDRYGVKATFFVIGENAENYPNLVEAEKRGGHEVANHTFAHSYLKNVPKDELEREIDRTRSIISDITESDPTLLRPPGGLFGKDLIDSVNASGIKIVLWSVDTRDWEHPSSATVVKRVLDTVKSGDIILMHDYIAGKSPTPEALETVIPTLLERGFKFVTVSELCASEDGS